jgi:HD superfamily phosphohydrolase YqeK
MPIPGIGDSELDEVAAIAHLACRKLDLAFLGELAGIAQQVEQDLPQPHGIHRQCAEVLLGVNDEAVLVLLSELARGADDLFDQRG